MAVEDADSPDPIMSGFLGAVCALRFKTACFLKDSKRYTAIHYIDPPCPLAAPWSANVVSVLFFAERWGSMLFFAPLQCSESVPTCAMLQEIQMEAFTPPDL